MDQAITAFIVSETEVAGQMLGDLGAAMRAGEPVDLAAEIRSYVLHRFLLADVVGNDEDDIQELATKSILHTLEITGGDLDAAGIITGCGGETTWVTKKVKLLFAIQDALGIRFDPRGIARIRTIGDLVEEIDELRLQARERPAGEHPEGRAVVREEKRVEEQSPKNGLVGIERIRGDFPFLDCEGGAPVYLDNAATMQIPRQVLEAEERFLSHSYANVHRGVYGMSEQATALYEHAREAVAAAIGASSSNIAFTSGTTAAINMVALGVESMIGPGDRIVITAMEHHSNHLPWVRLARRTGAELFSVPVTSSGELDSRKLDEAFESPTRLIALTHCSNVLGTVNPIGEICMRAREAGILTVVDGAQGVRHEPVDIEKIGCSWYAFSGHKLMSGPGIGVLYAADDLFDRIEPPLQGGGMVRSIASSGIEFERGPQAWEAGTPNVPGAIAFEEALSYRASLGADAVRVYEKALLDYVDRGLRSISRVRVLGQPETRMGCVSFVAEGLRAFEVSKALAARGICVRAGHHCAIPLHRQLGREASVRISPALYNTFDELDACLSAIEDCMLP